MGRYLRGSPVIGVRVTAMVLTIVLVTSAVTGWLTGCGQASPAGQVRG